MQGKNKVTKTATKKVANKVSRVAAKTVTQKIPIAKKVAPKAVKEADPKTAELKAAEPIKAEQKATPSKSDPKKAAAKKAEPKAAVKKTPPKKAAAKKTAPKAALKVIPTEPAKAAKAPAKTPAKTPETTPEKPRNAFEGNPYRAGSYYGTCLDCLAQMGLDKPVSRKDLLAEYCKASGKTEKLGRYDLAVILSPTKDGDGHRSSRKTAYWVERLENSMVKLHMAAN